MPTRPCSSAIASTSNTSRTRPLPLCTRSLPPSVVAMPAASWPRCWSTVRPSYNAAATSVVPTMPTMPHMVGCRSGSCSLCAWVFAQLLRMRTDDAVQAELRLDLLPQLVGLGAGQHGADADAGQRALVGADRFDEGAETGGTQA